MWRFREKGNQAVRSAVCERGDLANSLLTWRLITCLQKGRDRLAMNFEGKLHFSGIKRGARSSISLVTHPPYASCRTAILR